MFNTQSDARGFFEQRILEQADAERLPLSRDERLMLRWSESEPESVADPALAERLASEISDDEYEEKIAGLVTRSYAADIAPTTHPIRQAVDDVAAAAAGFDMITYPKGAAVLKQLHAFLGEDAFVEGLRGYFRKYAWGNTTLEDLMAEFSEASGRDLDAWVHAWLDTAGTDRLVLEQSGEGTVLRASGPEGTAPRPHRIGLGRYAWQGDSLVRQRLVTVETTGESTPVPDAADADLVLVNDEDLTFASV